MTCSSNIPWTQKTQRNAFAFKRGDTFSFVGNYVDEDEDGNQTPINLDDYTIVSQVRRKNNTLLSTAVITKSDQSTDPGEYLLEIANTTGWPLEEVIWDVQYTLDGRIMSTETVYITVTQDATQSA